MKLLSIKSVGVGLCILALVSCSKESPLPEVRTVKVENLTYHSAKISGYIVDEGDHPITSKGIVLGKSTKPTHSNGTVIISKALGNNIISNINLEANTKYYARTFATNDDGTGYGNEITFTSKPGGPEIGSRLGGGVVAYVYQPNDKGYVPGTFHGIIAAEEDINPAIYGCSGKNINTRKEIGSGASNTNILKNVCTGLGTAGSAFLYLKINGYSDWHLPSIEELELLYENREKIGGFDPVMYLSSSASDEPAGKPATPYYNKLSYAKDFNDSSTKTIIRFGSANIRPVRYF